MRASSENLFETEYGQIVGKRGGRDSQVGYDAGADVSPGSNSYRSMAATTPGKLTCGGKGAVAVHGDRQTER
jgi:hypothetical protein